jgi:hypothetical protein
MLDRARALKAELPGHRLSVVDVELAEAVDGR